MNSIGTNRTHSKKKLIIIILIINHTYTRIINSMGIIDLNVKCCKEFKEFGGY